MQSLAHFVVEVGRPGAGWEDLQRSTAQARRAATELQANGTAVRFLRSVFDPESEACFFLFEAPSCEAVEEALRRADLPFDHVVQTTRRQETAKARGEER